MNNHSQAKLSLWDAQWHGSEYTDTKKSKILLKLPTQLNCAFHSGLQQYPPNMQKKKRGDPRETCLPAVTFKTNNDTNDFDVWPQSQSLERSSATHSASICKYAQKEKAKKKWKRIPACCIALEGEQQRASDCLSKNVSPFLDRCRDNPLQGIASKGGEELENRLGEVNNSQ